MNQNDRAHEQSHGSNQSQAGMYVRFGAMILTAMVVMYAVMFVSTFELSHIRPSVSRAFMALTMGGAMGVVMLAWMLNMFRNTKANVAILVASVVLLGLGTFLDRSQAPVQDNDFMNSMIPHHSMAITRAERANLQDVRVCELAVAISEAQRREILEMDWLVNDIERNGAAATPEDAAARPVPDFERAAERQCLTR